MKSYIRVILNHRPTILAAVALFCILSGFMLTKAVISTSIGDMFLGTNPEYDIYLERINEFGGDNAIVVALEDDQPLAQESITRLTDATDKIAKMEFVDRVRSLLDAQDIRGENDTLFVDSYAELANSAGHDPATVMQRLLSDNQVAGLLISKDGRHHSVIVTLDPDPYRPAEKTPQHVADVLSAFKNAGYPGNKVHVLGFPANIASIIEQTFFSLTVLLPVVSVVLFLVVWIIFRRIWPVFITGACSGIAVLWTMGFAVTLDPKINILASVVPTVILIISFSDIIHLCSSYLLELEKGLDKFEAIKKSCSEVGAACFLTSLTTLIGFISFAVIPIPIYRSLGLILGFGAGIALIIAMTLTPIILSYMPKPKRWKRAGTKQHRDILDRFLGAAQHASQQRPKTVIAVFALLVLIMGAGATQFNLETNFVDRLSKNHPLQKDNRYYREHFTGVNSLEVYIGAKNQADLLDPETYTKIMQFQQRLQDLPEIGSVVSVVDLVERMHKVMLPAGEAQDTPKSRQLLAQYLLLFESSGGADLDTIINAQHTRTRVHIAFPNQGFRFTAALGDKIKNIADDIFATEYHTNVSGISLLLGSSFFNMLTGQETALVLVFVVISLVMAVGLRSFQAGMLAMIPNVLPMLFLLGFLGLSVESVDSDVLIIAILSIGIGVDDTVHFLMRYRIEIDRGCEPEQAIKNSFYFSGRAILITTLILTAGFSPLFFSSYLSIFYLGTLLPLTLIVAMLADLFLVPAMIRLGIIRFARKSSGFLPSTQSSEL